MEHGHVKRCLIADDTRSVRAMLDKWLTSEGYDCTQVADGKEAKTSIEASVPDLVLTDIEMPNFSGLELLRWLRTSDSSRLSTLPVIIITSLVDPELNRLVTQFGTSYVLAKPLADVSTIAMVRHATASTPQQSPCPVTPPTTPHAAISPRLRQLVRIASSEPDEHRGGQ